MKYDRYEKLVKAICEHILSIDFPGYTPNVNHNVKVSNGIRERQMDVFWESYAGIGIKTKVIVECKNWNSTVKAQDIESLKGFIDEDPELRGIYVTQIGYQSGAIEVCRNSKIIPYTLRESSSIDWNGKLKILRLNFRGLAAKIKNVEINADIPMENNIKDLGPKNFYIETAEEKYDIIDLTNQISSKITIQELRDALVQKIDIKKERFFEHAILNDGVVKVNFDGKLLFTFCVEEEISQKDIDLTRGKFVLQNEITNQCHVLEPELFTKY